MGEVRSPLTKKEKIMKNMLTSALAISAFCLVATACNMEERREKREERREERREHHEEMKNAEKPTGIQKDTTTKPHGY